MLDRQLHIISAYEATCRTFVGGGGHFNPLLRVFFGVALRNIEMCKAKLSEQIRDAKKVSVRVGWIATDIKEKAGWEYGTSESPFTCCACQGPVNLHACFVMNSRENV